MGKSIVVIFAFLLTSIFSYAASIQHETCQIRSLDWDLYFKEAPQALADALLNAGKDQNAVQVLIQNLKGEYRQYEKVKLNEIVEQALIEKGYSIYVDVQLTHAVLEGLGKQGTDPNAKVSSDYDPDLTMSLSAGFEDSKTWYGRHKVTSCTLFIDKAHSVGSSERAKIFEKTVKVHGVRISGVECGYGCRIESALKDALSTVPHCEVVGGKVASVWMK